MQAARNDHRILHHVEADRALRVFLLAEGVEHFLREDLCGTVRPITVREALDHCIDVDGFACGRLDAFVAERREYERRVQDRAPQPVTGQSAESEGARPEHTS